MKQLYRFTLMAAVAAALWLSVSSAAIAEDTPQATGEHWTMATEREKRAYLLGMASIIDLEIETQGTNPPEVVRNNSVIREFSTGLRDYSIPEVQQAIDAWYAAHPDQITRPVLETIWFELALPNLSSK
jgi:hypothetical protein